MNARPSVLVVDDEPGVRESLRAILARECTVYVAPTGEAALALLTSTPIDVITLDLRMPGMDGVALLERLRAGDRDVEAVIISGCPVDPPLVRAVPFGVFGCVSKPFDVDHVRSLVKAAALRRRAVRQLRETKERLVATIGEALAGSAHTIVRGGADAEGGLTEAHRRALGEICGDDVRLVRYLEGLLFLSALRTGRTPVGSGPVDVAALLGEAAAAHRARAAAKGVRVIVADRVRLAVRTDRRLLLRLLDVLLDNAVRFTSAGEVRMAAAAASTGVAITVRDTGVGLPAELETALCSRAGAAGLGIGLGLPTAVAIAEVLGGVLDVRAQAGAGTEVRITIPVRGRVPVPVTAEREARCAP